MMVHVNTVLDTNARPGHSTSIQTMLWMALLGQSSLFHFVKLLKLKNIFTSIASKNKLLVKYTDSVNSGNTSQPWGL